MLGRVVEVIDLIVNNSVLINELLSNLCRATSRGYINCGCSREVLFLGGNFQWSMCRAGQISMPVDRGSRSLEVPL